MKKETIKNNTVITLEKGESITVGIIEEYPANNSWFKNMMKDCNKCLKKQTYK